ncbi:MAG: hypothetical protein AUI15_29590 [Actinobacteria bacterium 13_2_20CM_2_66_6]|nr:MAG: hypothetical protein AUI15_29590 [Actinobacteria bacterium 13_2_20CM_2_66_6]
MQGAFAEHVRALEATGARTRLVRTHEDLAGLDGIVLPGGESTTMTMLMERVGLLEPLREAIRGGLAQLDIGGAMHLLDAGKVEQSGRANSQVRELARRTNSRCSRRSPLSSG